MATGAVEHVEFRNRDMYWDIAADLHFPPDFDESGTYPAIVVAHPNRPGRARGLADTQRAHREQRTAGGHRGPVRRGANQDPYLGIGKERYEGPGAYQFVRFLRDGASDR
ncbi:hypothetical protein SAMN05421854_106408 [Amycolatopsis rubida]|uniref:Uncharacterized protein n=1 Tax=Amycolatopsis rubida TaxID=112413 RepID=A0A1I5SPX7_9PSEU|nr:hypothetical protein SAMN05421854_106408 [Amycolatopsis rubida]